MDDVAPGILLEDDSRSIVKGLTSKTDRVLSKTSFTLSPGLPTAYAGFLFRCYLHPTYDLHGHSQWLRLSRRRATPAADGVSESSVTMAPSLSSLIHGRIDEGSR
jgi:hypothetical protein